MIRHVVDTKNDEIFLVIHYDKFEPVIPNENRSCNNIYYNSPNIGNI